MVELTANLQLKSASGLIPVYGPLSLPWERHFTHFAPRDSEKHFVDYSIDGEKNTGDRPRNSEKSCILSFFITLLFTQSIRDKNHVTNLKKRQVGGGGGGTHLQHQLIV